MTTRFRYWGWLVAKLGVATGATTLIYASLRSTFYPLVDRSGVGFSLVGATFDGILFGFWILPMIWVGLAWFCFRDQRYRCRTCARPLRMPLDHGSYSAMLLDHPSVEYVCPYGHGKLRVEVRLWDAPASKWTKQGDIWQELMKNPADQRG